MRRRLLAAFLLAAAACAALSRLPRPPLHEGIGFSRAVYDRKGRLLRLTLTYDGKYRLWVPLGEISPLLVDATLLHEDRNFRRHPGADPLALLRSAWITYVLKDRRVGGSTITMQLARLRWRIDSRTVPGKVVQILRALQLELLYGKDEILEAYLNFAPYGGNIEGVGAASLIYFRKNPDQLTLTEALTLSLIPQSPARWALSGTSLPFEAPHFVERLLASRREGRIVSTLDLGKQKTVERIVRAYLERHRDRGLSNASVLLADFRSMEVLAHLGSADYFDEGLRGQVDGTRSPRSPGSALKPFVYALGVEQGLLHPETLLKDAPTSFGAFNPENFDGDFAGPLKAREALVRSRNVPAVQVASRLRDPGLYAFLKAAGVPLPRDESHYGLGLVLGGSELSMEDLARLYALLANGGTLKALRRTLGESAGREKRLLSPEAVFLVMDMLKDNPRPRQAFGAVGTADPLPVYWKTGTSYAFKDAWSVGIMGPYVLAVWMGNFSGEGNPAFVGIEAAAPLFFELADALRAQEPGMRDAYAESLEGLNVARVRVCAVSGKTPGPHCPHAAWTWFVPGVSPIEACDVHRQVLVDRATGLRACTASGPDASPEVFEFWPSDILKIFRQAGIPRRVPPDYHPACGIASRTAEGLAPRITSPLDGVSYHLRAGGADETIPLSAVSDADARELHWFADEALLGKSPAGRPFLWKPSPGRFMVRVVDDQGRSDARELRVVLAE